jgi:hypothetical protein
MRIWLSVAAVLLVPACGYAQGSKTCEDLKTEIAAKLDAKGVKSYTLEIVAKDQDAEEQGGQHVRRQDEEDRVPQDGRAGRKSAEKKEPSKPLRTTSPEYGCLTKSSNSTLRETLSYVEL